MLLLLAGFAGVAMWASPPTALALGPLVVPVPLALVPVGLAASLACIVLGVPVAQGEGRGLGLLGALCAVLATGYGLSVALGLAAAVLVRQRPAHRALLAALRHHKGRFHGVGRWASHVGIVLVFIGYGASAYHATQLDLHDLSDPLQRGVPRDFQGTTLTLVDSAGEDLDHDGTFERVTAFVAVSQGGHVLDVAPITFYWVDKESQYRPTEHVVRGPLRDLYLNSNPGNLPAMHTAQDGWVHSNQAAVFATGLQPAKMRSADVDALSLSVKALPLVAPLWAGAVLLPFSMALTILAAPPRGFVKPARA
jgi:hypothetical protein